MCRTTKCGPSQFVNKARRRVQFLSNHRTEELQSPAERTIAYAEEQCRRQPQVRCLRECRAKRVGHTIDDVEAEIDGPGAQKRRMLNVGGPRPFDSLAELGPIARQPLDDRERGRQPIADCARLPGDPPVRKDLLRLRSERLRRDRAVSSRSEQTVIESGGEGSQKFPLADGPADECGRSPHQHLADSAEGCSEVLGPIHQDPEDIQRRAGKHRARRPEHQTRA